MKTRMRIGIDLFSLVPGVGRGGGFYRYITGLLNALYTFEDEFEYFLFVNRYNASLLPSSGRFVQKVVSLPPQRELWPFRLFWLHVVFPAVARHYKLDLVHFPMDTASWFLSVPYVVTIHDLIADVYYPEHFADSVSRAKTQYLFQTKCHSAHKANTVICPSCATAQDVERHYGLPMEKISVVPEAAEQMFFHDMTGSVRRQQSDVPYIVSVVSLSLHKNITSLVRAFARAREIYKLPHELRIIGMSGIGADNVRQSLQGQDTDGLPIRYMGFVDEEMLRTSYADADAFIFLSLIEGFGLPPLEAMASGVPVIASNRSSIPEVCGDAAILVPPNDIDTIADAIGAVLTQRQLAARLTEAGRCRAQEFSWIETASQTREIYQLAISRAQPIY